MSFVAWFAFVFSAGYAIGKALGRALKARRVAEKHREARMRDMQHDIRWLLSEASAWRKRALEAEGHDVRHLAGPVADVERAHGYRDAAPCSACGRGGK